MNEAAVLAAGALLPALCLAQPATAPGAAALDQIAALQQQQLLTRHCHVNLDWRK